MSMESLGGRMPAGRPAAVFAGGKTHVFAIAAGGGMNHWSSADGTSWTGPDELPRGPVNLEPSYACAIAAGGGVHVLAVNHNSNPFARGGAIAHWFSPDGVSFLAPILEQAWEIPGTGNGIAAAAPGGNAVEAFAVSGLNQLIRYSWSSGYSSTGAAPLPGPSLPASAPAAAAAGGGVTEVFAVAADGNALRWRIVNGVPVAPSVLPRPPGAPAGPLFHSGLTAVSPAPGQVEVFAITADGLLANWSIDGLTATVAYRSAPMPLHDSVPVALMVGDHLEVFAIGRPPGPFVGGPLIRWRRDRASGWSSAVTIGANLAAGGLGAAAGVNRVDAFGFNSGVDNSLLHWPAGIAAAQRDGWANWANNRQIPSPAGHCRPSTHEDVVAIVKTAEMVPGARVRAVGSSWSFSDIAMTPSFIVETRDITGVYTHVIDASVLTEHAPAAKYLLHVGAGTVVEDLMLTLDKRDLAPFTLGGSTGQTIAGVVSTSVHGSDIDRGPILHAVRALELVGPGGVQHWIEPDQWRITKEDQLRARLGPDVQIHYDDDWFDAALVSMGSMGIITSLVYEATDQYKLEKTCDEMRWSVLKPRLLAGTDFVDEHHSIMVAIDPVEMGDRTCYVTKRRDVPMSAVTTPPSGSPDPLGAFCEMNAEQALQQIGGLVGIGVVVDVAVTTAQALGIPIPVIPPGVSTAVTISIIVAALKLGGPGAIGDFVGSLCNGNSEAAAALATWLTRDTLKPGVTFVDVAHKIMAPPNPGECAARGLAIEVAFDVSTGGHIAFLDEAMAMLDMRRQDGMALGHGSVLGGYIGVRFMGPSRAILSPQQSARTCTVEITGLRSLHSTAPLLDELEKMATKHGAIQHWGMFSVPNLSAADLVRAYPRLDTWRRVRREITSNGTIQTFENAFTARVGLDAPPAGVPVFWQQEWRWCSKCMGMAYGGGKPGPCPAGGTHDHSSQRQLRLLAQRSVDARPARVALVQQVHGDDVLRPRLQARPLSGGRQPRPRRELELHAGQERPGGLARVPQVPVARVRRRPVPGRRRARLRQAPPAPDRAALIGDRRLLAHRRRAGHGRAARLVVVRPLPEHDPRCRRLRRRSAPLAGQVGRLQPAAQRAELTRAGALAAVQALPDAVVRRRRMLCGRGPRPVRQRRLHPAPERRAGRVAPLHAVPGPVLQRRRRARPVPVEGQDPRAHQRRVFRALRRLVTAAERQEIPVSNATIARSWA